MPAWRLNILSARSPNIEIATVAIETKINGNVASSRPNTLLGVSCKNTKAIMPEVIKPPITPSQDLPGDTFGANFLYRKHAQQNKPLNLLPKLINKHKGIDKCLDKD